MNIQLIWIRLQCFRLNKKSHKLGYLIMESLHNIVIFQYSVKLRKNILGHPVAQREHKDIASFGYTLFIVDFLQFSLLSAQDSEQKEGEKRGGQRERLVGLGN